MTTPILGLTELSNTSGERSTIIDTVRVLDAMWGRVASANININTPPTSPVDGTSVLISSAPTGSFSGFAGHLALFIGTGWQFVSPDNIGFVQTDTGPYEPNGTLDGWVPLTLPSGSPLTTKGDLLTYNNGDVRLAVGANGQVLVANSATPTGLEWVTQTSGGGGGGSALTLENNGNPLSTNVTKLNFTNFTITEPNPDEFNITAPNSGGGSTGFTLTDTDAINYFNNYATLANTHQKLITENLITRLKDSGLWSKIQLLWVNLGDTPVNSLIPLKGSTGTSSRTIVNADIETTGGLNPIGSFIALNFPALASNTSYHLGWAKLPHEGITAGGIPGAMYYRDTIAQNTGLAIEARDNQNSFWYAPGVAFAASGSTIRSYEAGGFVGTTDGTVRLAAKSTSNILSYANSPLAITTGELRIGLPTASPSKQPAFCAGQHLSLLEMTTLQIILEEYAVASL